MPVPLFESASESERYFSGYRHAVIGHEHPVPTIAGMQPMLYADWTASGRLYQPIEQYLQQHIAPLVANTHTETSLTGLAMTQAYHEARQIVKRHVNASADDACLFVGSGMTGALNKLLRMLDVGETVTESEPGKEPQKPVVFITHMEHHSNQLPWVERDVELEIIRRGDDGRPDLAHLQQLLSQHRERVHKIGAFSACSNVTGIQSDYHRMAELMHEHGGICVVDFACSAPYVSIDMHPENPLQALDAIVFSPHKFLGGPGSCGVLVFNRHLHHHTTPDEPGGGTVAWTNPWGGRSYFEEIELREDSGTPPFLQAMRAALAVRLKDEMGTDQIATRERALVALMFRQLETVPGLVLLEGEQRERLPVFSFYLQGLHHNLVCSLLSDRFAIQARGGCSCAGTLGHLLLGVDQAQSEAITCQIDHGDLSNKPGWIRISLHPTTTEAEVLRIGEALRQIAQHGRQWAESYRFDGSRGEYLALEPVCSPEQLPQLATAALR